MRCARANGMRKHLNLAREKNILLAGMNEMFSLPIGAGQRLNCDRIG